MFSLDSFRNNGKCGTNNNLLNVSGEVRELASWVGSPSCEFLPFSHYKMSDQQQQHKLYLHDYNYIVTVLQKL